MKLTKADLDYELEHKHHGNGLAIVQMLDDNYCRVTEMHNIEFGRRAFLAHGAHLKRFQLPVEPKVDEPIKPDLKEKLKVIRADIASGATEIFETRIMSPKEAQEKRQQIKEQRRA